MVVSDFGASPQSAADPQPYTVRRAFAMWFSFSAAVWGIAVLGATVLFK